MTFFLVVFCGRNKDFLRLIWVEEKERQRKQSNSEAHLLPTIYRLYWSNIDDDDDMGDINIFEQQRHGYRWHLSMTYYFQ